MGCKCAPACRQGLDDATKRWPERSRLSDGCCGDKFHQARQSDHNPDSSGYAHAFDLTNDPAHGVICDVLSLEVTRDHRVKYVIWNGRIFKTYKPAEGWQPYHGANKHDHHMHVSIKPNATFDLSPWPWSDGQVESKTQPEDQQTPAIKPLLSYGDGFAGNDFGLNSAVKELQTLLNSVLPKLGIKFELEIDGKFGAGCEKAVRLFQGRVGLVPDGRCGAKTWAALEKEGK